MRRSRLRIRPKRPPLTIEQILAWADNWFASRSRWPIINSGLIPGTIDDTWARIDDSLRQGYRGLPERPRLSLAKLLAKRRGVRNSEYPRQLSVSRIVKWIKSHRNRTGQWPRVGSGALQDAPGETWLAIDMALRKGRRGLRGGSSLAQLLADRCGVRNPARPPRLTVAKILRWADAYYARHGRRPTGKSGPIDGTVGETWLAIDKALAAGRRGLPGGSSLALLLDAKAAPLARAAKGRGCEPSVVSGQVWKTIPSSFSRFDPAVHIAVPRCRWIGFPTRPDLLVVALNYNRRTGHLGQPKVPVC